MYSRAIAAASWGGGSSAGGSPPSPVIASLPGDQVPNLVAVADHFAITDQDMRFELLLDIFVEGLARRAATWESDR